MNMKFRKSSKEIRQSWIDYFKSKNHLFIESKSLIPQNDPSLLWINSGVATLKDYFSGKKTPLAKRLVNSQKSIRTNDIENVGITARHHTFFEMLGNFSIGDYFKNEAIEFAHDVIINVFHLEQDRIYLTYFKEDEEVKNKWLSLGYKEDQLIPGDKSLNFWDVGFGPCGPNTEIFYDRGPKYHPQGPELIKNDIENDRFIEIWNIVFSEYNNLGNGEYIELKQKNIDTGAGLERIVSILQDGPTNFDTDLFLPIIYTIEKMCSFKYNSDNYFKNDPQQNAINKHFKIIADHMRAITNAISDGEAPSNTQRGYIIRRLIRRAYYSGKKLGITQKTFLYQLVQIVADTLVFPINIETVSNIIKKEENLFSLTIEQGKKILEEEIEKLSKNQTFDVKIAFKLYETFGFPIEMTNDILNENGIKLNFDELQKLKEEHSRKSKSKNNVINFDKQINSLALINQHISKFIGYDHLTLKDAKILYLLDEENIIQKSDDKNLVYLILEKTPLYATSGGQLHDQGYMVQNGHKIEVLDVFKDKNNNNVHIVKGIIDSSLPIDVYVDPEIRVGLMRNHSATHLTFAALRKIYGDSIQQLGSNNNQDRLTFDFPLNHKPTEAEIKAIEQFVQDVINQNIQRNYIETTIEQAKKMNAIMTINEAEYFDSNYIRVVEFPKITVDLCGGTHIDFTKNLEAYKITSVESKGTGIYRIRAITSHQIVNKYFVEEIKKQEVLLNQINKKYQTLFTTKQHNLNLRKFDFSNETNLSKKLDQIKEAIQQLNQDLKVLMKALNKVDKSITFEKIKFQGEDLMFANKITKINLKDVAIQQRERYPNHIIIAVSQNENGKSLIIITSKTVDVLNFINTKINHFNLKGGGNQLIWQGVLSSSLTKEDLQ